VRVSFEVRIEVRATDKINKKEKVFAIIDCDFPENPIKKSMIRNTEAITGIQRKSISRLFDNSGAVEYFPNAQIIHC
jgi:hypothetical protein